jgi:SulP family sulfate permease
VKLHRLLPRRTSWNKVARMSFLRREISAGITAGLSALPVCIASGVLAYAPLGAHSIAKGALAGLTGGAFSAIFAAIVASPSFVITAPRASISIIQGTLAASLLRDPHFAGHPQFIIDAMSLCGLLAGVWQVLFGVLRFERVIKSTPHPVLAGFINGVALLVIVQQVLQLLNGPMGWQPGDSAWSEPEALGRTLLAILLAAAMIIFGARYKGVSAMLVGLIAGIILYHLVEFALPGVALGPTIDGESSPMAATIPFGSLLTPAGRGAFLEAAGALIVSSFVLALVAALESLLAYRVAQNLSHVRTETSRDVIGQGVGNFMSALFGGVAAAASSAQLTENYEAGGRSRLSVLVAATLLLAVSGLLAPVWSFVPALAIWAVLIAIAVMLFDLWSLRALRDLFANPRRIIATGSWKNLAVAAAVTIVTASVDVITGVLVGILLACVLFIADMSRSIVRRRHRGDEIFSKRQRPAADVELLRQTGRRRAVLELQGVMFFGNADELSREVHDLFREVDMMVLDLRGVTDIDFSAATILQYEWARSHRTGKHLLLSNVLPQLIELLTTSDNTTAIPSTALMPDLDTALEWMEEETLRQRERSAQASIQLAEHDILRGLTAEELATLETLLKREEFRAGAVLCNEGEEAREMWILTRGSVSVRLSYAHGRRSLRVASLAVGTVVGEMAFLEEGSRRSATIIADEDVECYALERPAWQKIVRDHPQIATKLLANMLRETMHRLRNTSDELRAMSR